MSPTTFLHAHPVHRARQLRWVLPFVAALLVIAALVLAVQYRVSDQRVGDEFFRAHKTIAHTGELLRTGTHVGGAVLLVAVIVLGLLALRVTHRVVRPVHTLHRALDALAEGDLGVRLVLHRADEFQELARSLDRLVGEFASTLRRAHALADELVALSDRTAAEPGDEPARARLRACARELDACLEFFRLEPLREIRDERP